MSENIEDFSGGESVKVALRIRPMNAMEINRGDEQCIKPLSDKTCQLFTKYIFMNNFVNTRKNYMIQLNKITNIKN